MLSLYNLVINFPQLFGVFFATTPDLISALSALASVFVLILSLLEASKGYELKAERLHNSAMQLNGLYGEFLTNANNPEGIASLIKRYHAQLEACPENHEPCDDALFRAEHYKDFELNWLQAKGIMAYYFLRQRIFYIALLASPLGFLIIGLMEK